MCQHSHGFHVENKKKKTFAPTLILSHSPTSQMQSTNEQWRSSTLASTPPSHHCHGHCSHYGWDSFRKVNRTPPKKQKKIPGFRQVLAFLQTGFIFSFILASRSAGLLGGGCHFWASCCFCLSGWSFSWFLLSTFCSSCSTVGLHLFLSFWFFSCGGLLVSFLCSLCWLGLLSSSCLLWCCLLSFGRCSLSSSSFLRRLLRILLGLLEGEATELEGGLLEGETLFLLLAILTGGWSALLWLGRSLAVCLLLSIGFSTLYFLTFFFFFGCLLGRSAAIGLDVSFVCLLCRWRRVSIGLGMAILLQNNTSLAPECHCTIRQPMKLSHNYVMILKKSNWLKWTF